MDGPARAASRAKNTACAIASMRLSAGVRGAANSAAYAAARSRREKAAAAAAARCGHSCMCKQYYMWHLATTLAREVDVAVVVSREKASRVSCV